MIPAGAATQLKPVALIAALKSEAACFAASRPLPGLPADLDDRFTLMLGGMGPERAARAAERMIREGARAVMSVGMAGALQPRVSPGDILLPERVADAGGSLHTTVSWRAAILERLADATLIVHGGLLRSVPSVLGGAPAKSEYGRTTGAVAVDMESAAIVKTALQHGVPAVVVRVAVDLVDVSLPVEILGLLDPYGGIRIGQVLRAIGAKPVLVPNMIRLARAERAARRILIQLGQRRHELLAPDVAVQGRLQA